MAMSTAKNMLTVVGRVDRSRWVGSPSDGPWWNEPDDAMWTDSASLLRCVAWRDEDDGYWSVGVILSEREWNNLESSHPRDRLDSMTSGFRFSRSPHGHWVLEMSFDELAHTYPSMREEMQEMGTHYVSFEGAIHGAAHLCDRLGQLVALRKKRATADKAVARGRLRLVKA